MVMRILGTTSHENVQLIRGCHTGQDSTTRRPLREKRRQGLGERRNLRQGNLVHQAELAYLRSIDVDANLLTGNLDQDISILTIMA